MFDYVKTVQAASGVPRFLKPVRLEERGAPASTCPVHPQTFSLFLLVHMIKKLRCLKANFVYEASNPLRKQLQFTCARTAMASTTAEDVERS